LSKKEKKAKNSAVTRRGHCLVIFGGGKFICPQQEEWDNEKGTQTVWCVRG